MSKDLHGHQCQAGVTGPEGAGFSLTPARRSYVRMRCCKIFTASGV